MAWEECSSLFLSCFLEFDLDFSWNSIWTVAYVILDS